MVYLYIRIIRVINKDISLWRRIIHHFGADCSREGGGIMDDVESNIVQAVGADGSR